MNFAHATQQRYPCKGHMNVDQHILLMKFNRKQFRRQHLGAPVHGDLLLPTKNICLFINNHLFALVSF